MKKHDIEVHKSVLWQKIKGELKGLSVLEGHVVIAEDSGNREISKHIESDRTIEDFIYRIEKVSINKECSVNQCEYVRYCTKVSIPEGFFEECERQWSKVPIYKRISIGNLLRKRVISYLESEIRRCRVYR